jgi:signal transduction histidine kinase
MPMIFSGEYRLRLILSSLMYPDFITTLTLYLDQFSGGRSVLPTISWVMEEFQKHHSDIHIQKEIAVEEKEIKVSLKAVIFRILQEALSNIAKHSRADNVRICLKKLAGRLEFVIEDNGIGFDLRQASPSESSERGFGLASMRERTELSKGRFAIESAKGKGTTLSASWLL